jgi:outer membrane receptor protein involved in Fe transport
MRILRLGFALSTVMVMGLSPAICWASETSSPGQSSSGQYEIEEVVVTATKRQERQQDVGASISVVSGAALEELHVASLADLSGSVPGLVINSNGGPGQTNIAIRGLNSQHNGSLVATLIDDMPVGSSAGWALEDSYQLDMLPYDLTGIEILRGPQGTLYGANSMGGVLKYVTKYPSLTATEAQIGAEGFDVQGGGSLGYGGRAAFGAPIIDDTLALRISLYDKETPGFIVNPLRGDNHENSTEQSGARIALLWQAAPNLTVKSQAIYQRIVSDGENEVWAQAIQDGNLYTQGPWLQGDGEHPHEIPERFDGDLKFGSITVNWDMSFASLTSATSYSDKTVVNPTDSSYLYGYLQPLLDPATTSTNNLYEVNVGTKKFTEELRFASPTGQRVEWMLGAFYTDEKAYEDEVLEALDANLDLIPALDPFGLAYIDSSYKERAVFGNLTLRITDELEVTGGLRRLHNDQVVNQSEGGLILQPPTQTVSGGTADITNYMGGVQYHFSHDTMVYARVADGYRPGEPNVVTARYPQIPAQTSADTMTNYELGIKSDFLSRRVSVDFDIFKINWKNLQSEATTPDGDVSYNINAGAVTSEGAELSATTIISDALRVSLNTAYTDAYAAQAVETSGITIADGARAPTAPKWTAALKGEYQFPHIASWTPKLTGSWRYISSEYSAFSSATPVGLIPGYSLFDMNLGLTSGRYDVALYARNLLNKRVYNFALPETNNTTGQTFISGALVQPLTVGLSLDVKF